MLHFSSLISKRNNSCLPLQNQMEVNTLSSSFPNTVIVGKQVPASPSLRGTLLARICNPCLSLRGTKQFMTINNEQLTMNNQKTGGRRQETGYRM